MDENLKQNILEIIKELRIVIAIDKIKTNYFVDDSIEVQVNLYYKNELITSSESSTCL
jgi:hypothetical protein